MDGDAATHQVGHPAFPVFDGDRGDTSREKFRLGTGKFPTARPPPDRERAHFARRCGAGYKT
jgi:hypothetical protein